MSKKKYNYPIEKINIKEEEEEEEEEEEDDKLTKEHIRLSKIVNELEKLPKQVQHSEEWHKGRELHMTGSDSGCFMGVNKYEPQYKFIIKKVWKQPFSGNCNTYHGNKYEEIVTMFYEEINNVKVSEFGLIEHPNKESGCDFLAISPDGIVSKYKKDIKHKTNLVGRMIEIKCPVTRRILKKGDIKGKICPIYYWTQVQLQLECCNLEECDFVQCKIVEYINHDEFVNDSIIETPWLSKDSGHFKGAVIQILPKKNMNEILEKYEEAVWKYSKFIYPPDLKMSPYEYDKWIARTIENMEDDKPAYYIDKVIYWKLDDYHIQLIKRDKEWFEEGLPLMKKIWKNITILRNSPEKAELLKKYIDCQHPDDIVNKIMMESIDAICNDNKKEIERIKKEIKILEEDKQIKDEEYNSDNCDECMFSDDENTPTKKTVKKSTKKSIEKSDNRDECMFSDSDSDSDTPPKTVKKSTKKPIEKSDNRDECMFSDSDTPPKTVKKSTKKPIEKSDNRDECMFSDSDSDIPPKKSTKKLIDKPSKKSIEKSDNSNECMFSDSDSDTPPKKSKK